jgi:hypothetical protein
MHAYSLPLFYNNAAESIPSGGHVMISPSNRSSLFFRFLGVAALPSLVAENPLRPTWNKNDFFGGHYARKP